MFICFISIFNKYGKLKLDGLLRPLNMDWRELVVMLVIEQVPGISQTRLVPFVQTDKANVTKLLQQMEQKGLIRREADRGDQRAKVCCLTGQGETLLPRLHEILNDWEDACFQGVSREDRQAFARIGEIITGNLMEEST